jgi:ATP-binding cassette, subfamily B, multidrug efflux pump
MKALLRLGTFIRPYIKQVVLSSIMLLILMGIDLIFPTIIQKVIDIGLVAGQQQYLINATLILIALGLVKAGGSFVQRYQVNYIAQHISYDLRNKLFNHIQHLPFTFHDHTQSGQLISRTIEDVRSIQNFTSGGLIELIREALLTIGITFVLFSSNAKLAFISLLPLIPLVLWTTNFGKRISKLFLKVNNILGDLSSQLQENVTGVQVVRAFAREDYEVERFNKINRTLYDGQVTVVKERSQNMATTTFLITFGTLLILWFGGQMVLNHQLSLGELVAFNSYMLLLATPAQQLGWLVNAGGEAAAGVQRTMEILDRRPEIQSLPDAPVLSRLEGRIEFDHVSFKYAGESKTALEDIHVVIEPNQVVALIGPTGSGKTSLVNLIPRFYDVCQGCVRVDGQDIRQVDLVSLRQQIGIVLQSSLLFSASIRENIAYGHPGASEAEIIGAAKAAQAHDFIIQLPNGYDTVVGERGVTLSGGQRQRVAIARALLLDPRILILDDSTSSVDTQTEHLIQQALEKLMDRRTTFVIAQRLSTVKRADVILVLDQGKIVEWGKHADLLANGGLYQEIYELQLRDQERYQEEMELLESLQTLPSDADQQDMTPIIDSGNP